MAHSKQALKRHRQSEEKRAVNKNARTRMKSAVKKVLAGGGDPAAVRAEADDTVNKIAAALLGRADTPAG